MKKNPSRNLHLKKNPSRLLEKINNSIDTDHRLYKEDIEGSIAHAKMLGKQKIIFKKEELKIVNGLKSILKSNAFYFSSPEDVKNYLDNFTKKEHSDKVENCFNDIEKHYSWDIINNEYLNFFCECKK